MAFLRGVRDFGRRSELTGPVRTAVVLVLVLVGAGCREPDLELRPDAFLRDSLGLGDEDRVHRIRLGNAEDRERIAPVQVTVRPGDWVEFVTEDRRVHTIRFLTDRLPPDAAAFLTGSGQDASPPLVEVGARFVMSFAGAPESRYPFVVSGNGEDGLGAIVVAADGKGGG